jgi:hypothetical protein
MKKLLTVTAALVAVAFLAGPVLAEKGVASSISIDDKAGAFTADGIKKAEDAFHAVTFKSPTHLNIVTYKTVPENKRSEYDTAKANKDTKARFFKNWTTELAEKRGSRGVFVLVSMEGAHVHAIDDRQTDSRRGFDDADLKRVEEKIGDGFVKGNKMKDNEAEAKKARDEGLVNAVNYVIAELKNTSAPETPDQKVAAKKAGGGLSILQWVLIIGGGLLVMWIVIGLIRALTGGGGGGGGGYGGGGGGGGGFFSSLMGGMFGAMAGMYLYNSMFGGGMSDASAAGSDGYGGDGGNYDNGAGDYGGGGDGGGTDFDAGGGDAGAGGDWGGDAGGGDFGGGGGDFGGGGDW